RPVFHMPSPVVLGATLLGPALVAMPVVLISANWLLGPDGTWLMREGFAFLLRTRKKGADGSGERLPQGGPGVYVEFVGLPGAGKSVASRRVADSLRHMGLTVTEPTYHMDHVLRPAVRRVLKAWYALRGLFNELREAGFWSQVLCLPGQPTIGRLAAGVRHWC